MTSLPEKINLKIDRYYPLVMHGFSNCLGLFQVIMANPDIPEYCHGRPPGQDLTPVDHKFVDRPSPAPKAGFLK